MKLLIIIGIVIGLVVLYFSIGMLLKFLWGWWILTLAIPLCIFIGVYFGWLGAIGGLVGFIIALNINNEWHNNQLYLNISKKIDGAFYFSDT